MLAKCWLKTSQSDQHFFASLDFSDGTDIFRRLGLQSAPTARLFHPTVGPRASARTEPETFDFTRGGTSAEAFLNFVQTQTGLSMPWKRPRDYTMIAAVTVSILTLISFAFVFWGLVSPFIFGKNLWAFGTLSVIILMTSGHMWNQIRNPPFLVPGPNGGINWFAGGYSNQYGIETQIVGTIYATLGFSFYVLAVVVPKIPNKFKQRLAIYVWMGILVVMFSILLSIFGHKSPGYPFRFLF